MSRSTWASRLTPSSTCRLEETRAYATARSLFGLIFVFFLFNTYFLLIFRLVKDSLFRPLWSIPTLPPMCCSGPLSKWCTAPLFNFSEGWVIDDSEGCAEGLVDLCWNPSSSCSLIAVPLSEGRKGGSVCAGGPLTDYPLLTHRCKGGPHDC